MNTVKRVLVLDKIRLLCVVWVCLLLQISVNVKVEKLNADFEHLIIVNSHQHQQVHETELTDLNQVWVALNCELKPLGLFLEELAKKITDSPRQNFKNMPTFLHICLQP